MAFNLARLVLRTNEVVGGHRALMESCFLEPGGAAEKARISKSTTYHFLEARAAFMRREERALEDLETVIAKAQVEVSTRMEALAEARLEWKAMHAELLQVTRSQEFVAEDPSAGDM